MLNINWLRYHEILQALNLKNLLFLLGVIAISALAYYLVFNISGSKQASLITLLLTFFSLSSIVLAVNYFSNKIHTRDSQKKTVLLLSHDDELAGQLRYTLPNETIRLQWVRTYDSAIKVLSKNSLCSFMIDTENKPKNTATLIELCRNHEKNIDRLPIIAIQKNLNAEKKYQLLLEGFDDCLPKKISQKDINNFCIRWSTQKATTIAVETTEQQISTDNKTLNTPANTKASKPKSIIVDKELALIQSHQNYELAKDMLTMLIAMLKQSKPSLKQWYTQKNWPELGELTHKIKGGCYCCGVPSLQEAVENIDKKLDENTSEDLSNSFTQMMTEIDRLLQWDTEFDVDIIFARDGTPY